MYFLPSTRLGSAIPSACVCNRVQPQKHSMEIMNIMDILTPIYGGKVEVVPPYVDCPHSGQPGDQDRTEEAAGSNPARSTKFHAFLHE